ncbi:MAG: hypothetical protein M3161_05685 [Actinomycetota bacterium]|nr:hypothetical protein [Actinomycetota bacterium]
MIELAHGVGRVYESPLPTWLYWIGAAATVAASFVIRALSRDEPRATEPRRLAGRGVARAVELVARVLAFVVVALMVISGAAVAGQGLLLAPLLFWVALIVATAAANAVVDGLWRAADPWRVLVDVYARPSEGTRRRGAPPWWIGPLSIYALFWFELVSGVGFASRVIAAVVIGYTAFVLIFRPRLNDDWSHVDPLAILFGFAGRGAPLVLDDDGIYYRGPVAGLDQRDAMPLALFGSLFVLLGSTTLDNVRETVGWTEFRQAAGIDALPVMVVDSVALIAFAFVFFIPFVVSLVWARSSARVGVMARARLFGWSLVPIGVAYLLAHNAPLLMTGVPQAIAELSDPFARGWNLFGTANLFHGYIPSPAFVWFLEIALIVGGHVIGVLVAHRIAVRIAGSHREAVVGQIALTVLMSLFTIMTLALLSQPLVA